MPWTTRTPPSGRGRGLKITNQMARIGMPKNAVRVRMMSTSSSPQPISRPSSPAGAIAEAAATAVTGDGTIIGELADDADQVRRYEDDEK
jgi:hypothetical protein